MQTICVGLKEDGNIKSKLHLNASPKQAVQSAVKPNNFENPMR